MKDPKTKPRKKKYESPVMVDFGEVVRGYGVCQSGGSPSSGIGKCTVGLTAKNCRVGNYDV